jgi:hypothetical protein
MELDTKKIIEALKKLDMPEYRNLDNEDKENGYRQMCQDLKDLAEKDGCSGAAFALSVFSAIANEKEGIKESDNYGFGLGKPVEIIHGSLNGDPVTTKIYEIS